MPVPEWNADIITPDSEASAEIISGGGLVKDETGAVGVSVDGETIVINNEGALQAIGRLPYNLFKCRYAAGTAPSSTAVITKWKDTESSDNIWYVACYDKAYSLFHSDTGLVEVMDATIQLPLLDTSSMFYGCTALTSVPLFDLSSSTTTSSMFYGCTALTSVPLFDLSSSTTTHSMFNGCTALTSVPLFDLSSATTTQSMFNGCTALTSVPLFDLSSATSTQSMFSGCTALTRVPLFDLSSAKSTGNMFKGCTSVETGALALYQQVSTQATPPTNHSSMFTNCGSGTTTGAAELAQIPTSWGGTMA